MTPIFYLVCTVLLAEGRQVYITALTHEQTPEEVTIAQSVATDPEARCYARDGRISTNNVYMDADDSRAACMVMAEGKRGKPFPKRYGSFEPPGKIVWQSPYRWQHFVKVKCRADGENTWYALTGAKKIIR